MLSHSVEVAHVAVLRDLHEVDGQARGAQLAFVSFDQT